MSKKQNGWKGVPATVTVQAITRFLTSLDCPRAQTVYMLWKYKEYDQLRQLEWIPHYQDIDLLGRSFAATMFLRKAEFLELGVNLEALSFRKFLANERRCRETNRRFRNLEFDPLYKGANVWLLNATIRKITQLLGSGDFTGSRVEEMAGECHWGPGTTSRVHGDRTGSAHKFRSDCGITRDCYSALGRYIPLLYPEWGRLLKKSFPLWGEDVDVLDFYAPLDDSLGSPSPFDRGDSLLFIAKDFRSMRGICPQPGINCWFQLGAGALIAKDLWRFGGIDLTDQSRNRLLCKYASFNGKLTTADFSSASEMISKEVVRACMAEVPGWLQVLSALRTPACLVPQKLLGYLSDSTTGYPCDEEAAECLEQIVDGVLVYEKFSAMGNGFTFPLQSLIFTAAALACCEYVGTDDSQVGVFGDDVVIPTDAFGVFCDFSKFLGFEIGLSKSFSEGYFRESCGAYYCRGFDVKPIYLRDRLNSLESLYAFANSVRTFAHRRSSGSGCDYRFRGVWAYIVGKVPKKSRNFIPIGYGDGGLVGNLDEAPPETIRTPDGLYVEGYIVVGVDSVVPVGDKVTGSEFLCSALSSSPPEEADRLFGCTPWQAVRPARQGKPNFVPRRKAIRRIKQNLHIQHWNDLGPWIKI